MFDPHVDSFLHISVADTLVDDDAHCGLCDIVDDAGFPMVDLVGHARIILSASNLDLSMAIVAVRSGPTLFVRLHWL